MSHGSYYAVSPIFLSLWLCTLDAYGDDAPSAFIDAYGDSHIKCFMTCIHRPFQCMFFGWRKREDIIAASAAAAGWTSHLFSRSEWFPYCKPISRQLPSSFSCSVDLRWYVSLLPSSIFMMTSPLSLAPLRPAYAFPTVIFFFSFYVTTACISTPLLSLLSGLPTVGGWHCASQECDQHPL
jgi:hypothetical protein